MKDETKYAAFRICYDIAVRFNEQKAKSINLLLQNWFRKD